MSQLISEFLWGRLVSVDERRVQTRFSIPSVAERDSVLAEIHQDRSDESDRTADTGSLECKRSLNPR